MNVVEPLKTRHSCLGYWKTADIDQAKANQDRLELKFVDKYVSIHCFSLDSIQWDQLAHL